MATTSAAFERPGMLGRSRMRRTGAVLAAAIGAGWLVAFTLATRAAEGSELASQVVGDVVYVIGVAAAAGFSVVAALRAQPHQRLFWRLLALSNLGWLAGEILWAVLELGLGQEVPFPSVADALYLGSYVMVLPAIALGSTRLVSREQRWRALLDTSIVVVAIAYVGWMALIRPQLAWGMSLATATGIAYPLLGVAILMLLVTTGRGIRAMPLSLRLVGAGFLASALTDAAYTYFVSLHEFVAGSWLNIGWQLEAVLLCLAALAAIRGEQPARQVRPGRDVGLGVVVAGTSAVVALVARELTGEQLSVYGAVLACFAIGALVLRMYVTTREKESIARRLDRSVSLLHATLESTADGILVVDTHGRITSWNEKFATMWRIPTEVLEAGDPARVAEFGLRDIVEPERLLANRTALFGDPRATSFDVIDFSDGRSFERYSQPQQLDGRTAGRVWSFRDITERRRLEEDLRQAQKMEAVGRLAGGIAHDFNNLLTVISGYAEVIAANPAAPRVADDARQVQRAASRAAELTHQLLAFGRKQLLRPQQIDLAAVVEDVQPLLRSLVGETVRLTFDLDPGNIVEVDPGQMEQVVVNLALNARDAMPAGGTLAIRIAAEAGHVTLVVSDTGVGMDEETLTRATEPFFTTKAAGEGTGLGLATAVGIIEQSGGTLTITSKAESGTQVTVALPALARTEAA
jgi:signal transduction histidine kinase